MRIVKQIAERTLCMMLCIALLLVCILPQSFAEAEDADADAGTVETAAESTDETDEDTEGADEESLSAEETDETPSAEEANSDTGEVTEIGEESTDEADEAAEADDTGESAEDSAGDEPAMVSAYAEEEEPLIVTFVWIDDVVTEISVDAGAYAETLTVDDMPEDEALEDYLTGCTVEWYSDAAYETAFDFSSAITESVTLYACFVELPLVTFVWADGVETVFYVEAGAVIDALSLADMPEDEALDAYREDYDLEWYSDITFETLYDFAEEVIESVTLYAGFTPLYTVEYVWTGSEEVAAVTVREGALIEAPDITAAPEDIQAQYDCRYQVYWFVDDALTEQYDFETEITDNLTLYAGYEIRPEMRWFTDTTLSAYTLITAAELQSLSVLTAGGYSFEGVTIYLGESRDDEVGEITDGVLDLSAINWTPIGNAEYPFAGTFDGGIYGADADGELGLDDCYTLNGVSISNYAEYEYAGLFGYVTGTIRNVSVSGLVYVTADYAGGIVGWLDGSMTNCASSVTVRNHADNAVTGGLAGYVSGSVYRSENSAQIVYNQSSGSDAIGGLVGVISGFITDSENAGGTYVLGNGAAAGGIIGRIESGSSILRCINNGARVQNTGDDGAAGGIVGEMADGTQVQYCGNIAAVTSSKSNTPGVAMAAAGIAGRLLGDGEIASCFNKGDVTCTGGTRGGIAGYAETGYNGNIALCCNLSAQSGTWADADYVTATADPAEAAYIMDNGGSERYEKWGWADGDSTPILVSNGATPVYKVKLTAVKSKIEALTRNYFTVGETVTLYAAKTLEDGDVWVIDVISDYEVSADGSAVSFVMPADDVTLSATITNPDKGYTVSFLLHDGDEWEDEDNVYDEQTVMGGDLAVRPEEQDDAEDLSTIYAYYNDAGEFRGYYIFLGWYLDENGELAEEEYDFELLVSEDMILYAQWAIVTIQFNLNGVDCTTSVPASYETGVGVTLPEPTPEPTPKDAEENTLRGWSTTQKPAPGDEADALWVFDTEDAAEAAAVSEDDSDDDSDDTPTVLTEDIVGDGMTVTMYAIWADSIYNWAVTYGVSGNGTESDPFMITKDDQLNSMAGLMGDNVDVSLEGYYFQLSADGDNGGQFKLTESIVPYHDYSYDATEDDYVHTYGGYFQGVFDGGSEDGCMVDVTDAQLGMFGIIGENGEVRNLNTTGDVISNYDETSDYYFTITASTSFMSIGSIAAVNYGKIENCTYDSGEISTGDKNTANVRSMVGGITGCIANDGTVSDCQVLNATIEGDVAGGIVGGAEGDRTDTDSFVENCDVSGSTTVSGHETEVVLICYGVGGIVGCVGNPVASTSTGIWTISNCTVGMNDGDSCVISANGDLLAGGIAGLAENSYIEGCKNGAAIFGAETLTTDVSNSPRSTGGIVGLLQNGSVSNCENAGSVTANEAGGVGGVVGWLSQFDEFDGEVTEIKNCKNEGEICSSETRVVFRSARNGGGMTTLSTGGIVGGICMNVNDIVISNCENMGNIIVSSTCAVGGIIGSFGDGRGTVTSSKSETLGEPYQLVISGCKQSGETIYSSSDSGCEYPEVIAVGGVLGLVFSYELYSTDWTFVTPEISISECEVSTTLQINSENTHFVGGIIGANKTSAEISIENVKLSDDFTISVNVASTASDIGGVSGSSLLATYKDVDLGALEIEVLAGAATSVGGVSGEITLYDDTTLEGITWDEISINVDANAVSSVGGIAGRIIVSGDEEDTNETNHELDFGDVSGIAVTVCGTDNSYIGGAIGYLAAKIGKITAKIICEDISVEVSGNSSEVGGIIGILNNGILTESMFDGSFSVDMPDYDVGGLTGCGDIEYSYFLGSFECNGSSVGLLTGGGSTKGVTSSYFYGNGYASNGISGDGTANVTASYYLGTSDSGQSKMAEQFASGEVAWLMETLDADSECLGTNHIYVWTQGTDYPEWSYGGSTVNRVRAEADPSEGGTVTLNDSSEAVYVVSEEQVTVTANPSTEQFDYSEDEDGNASWYEYTVEKITAAVDDTGAELSSSESAVLTFFADADSLVTASFVKELHEEAGQEQAEGEGDGEGDNEGDGSGDGDEDAAGDDGDGGEDGSGRGGSSTESTGSVAPSADGEPTDEYIYNDSSDEFQMEESLGEEAPEGGAEVEETVEGPETDEVEEPEPEPEEIEEAAEPERHVFELTTIVTAIKENPLMTAIIIAAVIGICVVSGVVKYRKYKRDFEA